VCVCVCVFVCLCVCVCVCGKILKFSMNSCMSIPSVINLTLTEILTFQLAAKLSCQMIAELTFENFWHEHTISHIFHPDDNSQKSACCRLILIAELTNSEQSHLYQNCSVMTRYDWDSESFIRKLMFLHDLTFSTKNQISKPVY